MANAAQQQATLFRAIAVSSLHLPGVTSANRQAAFGVLEEFKRFDGRLSICMAWLTTPNLYEYQGNDITTATKLLALEVLGAFLQTDYSKLAKTDRVAFRRAVLQAARNLSEQQQQNASSDTTASSMILARKLATILEGLVLRDFPQRWTTFATDVLGPQGGLWYDTTTAAASPGDHVGVRIVLRCLQLTAEDCTDSLFNVKINTSRRNDVLIGLNEIAPTTFLKKMYELLEQTLPILQQCQATLHQMHLYLQNQNRSLDKMTAEESAAYQSQVALQTKTTSLLTDTLETLEQFCSSMPLNWITGMSDGNAAANTASPDFLVPLQYFLRQPPLQIQAAACLEQLVLRGKLSYPQWMKLVAELPGSIQQASQAAGEHLQHAATAAAVGSTTTDSQDDDPLTAQLGFYRALSRLLATVLSSSIAHITSSSILKTAKELHVGQLSSSSSPEYNAFTAFVRVAVDLLHHPSPRVCSEQINMWVALLRDPQIGGNGSAGSGGSTLLEPVLGEIMTCYMDHMVRIRWSDVEEQIHPLATLLEASFDDEDAYHEWMRGYRPLANLLFKYAGHTAPAIAAPVVQGRFQQLLQQYGAAPLRDHVDPSNGQLTPNSDAVRQMEGIIHPFENTLSGIPAWAMMDADQAAPKQQQQQQQQQQLDNSSTYNQRLLEIRSTTKAALSELATALVSWNPTDLWLKFRRATLLDALKYYWKYNPSTLLPAVESLIRNLGLPDEWKSQQQQAVTAGEPKLSGEIVGLKRKSGVTLVSVSKMVPHHLVPWLSQLTEATRTLLSSSSSQNNSTTTFLSCIATAVEDPVTRANFVGGVLSSAVETLESALVQQGIASVPALLASLGVSQAATHPASVTDPTQVQQVTANYNRLFTALNQLLSVGRRCHEAARRRRGAGSAATTTAGGGAVSSSSLLVHSPDEGPVSIQELARNDPFVPLWPRILPTLLQVYEVTLGVWRPEHQGVLLSNAYQRYVYAISDDDEAFLSQNHGGTAGSVVAGVSRRDVNLVPKWRGWFNKLRNLCFQMLGLLTAQRVLFAPEVAHLYPRIVAVLTEPINLKSMEHRQFTQFQKHVVEFLLVNCPSTLYKTHLEPLVAPIFAHVRFRLEKTWSPILSNSSVDEDAAGSNAAVPKPTKALVSDECNKAAALALSKGNDDDWFSWCYAHAGLFVGDLDVVTADAAVEKARVELSRTFSNMMQVALALKGAWALVLANQAKEEQAQKKNDASKLVAGRFNTEGAQLNADGTPKAAYQAALDAQQLLRMNRLCHFLLLESEPIAGDLTLTMVQCLGYPDACTCRRITKICHRILETVAWSPQYTQLLGQHMFTQAVKNVVTEPKWMVGIEWDMINVVRDIYCRLVLGQILQFGGQGPGQQQVALGGANDSSYEQAKTADRPLQGGGILTVPSNTVRQVLGLLPGCSANTIQEFETKMKQKRWAKDQKDTIRDLLRMAADNLREMSPTSVTDGSAAGGIFDRAVEEESLLHSKTRAKAIVYAKRRTYYW